MFNKFGKQKKRNKLPPVVLLVCEWLDPAPQGGPGFRLVGLSPVLRSRSPFSVYRLQNLNGEIEKKQTRHNIVSISIFINFKTKKQSIILLRVFRCIVRSK